MKHSIKTGLAPQKGFSLLIALIFVSFFGAILTGFVYDRTGESMRDEAEITGWQAAKIARAARVYVRDQFVANPNLKATLDIDAGGPQTVQLSTLISESLLPSDFARSTGGRFFTALDQEISVIMANYPIDGEATDENTVPTAYIYFRDSDRSNASLVQDIVQAARRENVSVSAPVFDGSANISGNCNGMGDSVVIWDSGCMGTVEFAALTGETFEPGSLVIPAWRSVNYDSRVLTRYPQPEMDGMATMLTELEMGDPLADCATNPANRVKMPSDSGLETVTELCGAHSDNPGAVTAAAADRRRDILNTRNLVGNSYIDYHQAANDVTIAADGTRVNAATDEAHGLNIGGNLVATGDMKVFGSDMTIGQKATIDRNVMVPTRMGQTVTANIGGVLSGNSMSSETLEVFNNVNTGATISSQTANVTPAAVMNGGLVTNKMQMNTSGANVNVTGNADMLGTTTTGSTTITGASTAGSFTYVAGNLNTRNINVQNNVNVNDTAVFNGGATIGRIDVTNGGSARCAGDCPPRHEYCISQGALTYEQCMEQW